MSLFKYACLSKSLVFKTQLVKLCSLLDGKVFDSLSIQLLSGFLKLYNNCECFFNKNEDQFLCLGSILEKGLSKSNSVSVSFQLITSIISDDYFHVLKEVDNAFDEKYLAIFTKILFTFLDSCNNKQGIPTEYIYQSYNLLFKLFNLLGIKNGWKISSFSEKLFSFLNELLAIALYSESPHSSKQNALSTFQKCIMVNGLVEGSIEETCLLFSEVLFPILCEISKNVTIEEELPFRVFSILSKLVLQCIPLLKNVSSKFLIQWQRYLSLLCEQYKSKDTSDKSSTLIIKEAILEILKNILLILKATFDEPGNISIDNECVTWRNYVWDSTWKIIESILPTLKSDLGMNDIGLPSPSLPNKTELETQMEKVHIESEFVTNLDLEEDTMLGLVADTDVKTIPVVEQDIDNQVTSHQIENITIENE